MATNRRNTAPPAKRERPVAPVTAMTVKPVDALADAEQARKNAALAIQHNSDGWGLPNDPKARKVLMAITAYYGLDFVMGDINILGGNTLYITEQAYKKKLDEMATAKYQGRPWRWRKRPATKEEKELLGYPVASSRVWYTELYPPEGCGESLITSAFGEANVKNCTLQNSTKQVGDPRVLDRMAIKRAQHECARDVVVFRLPSPADFEKKLGVALDDMLESGVNVILDDGIIPQGSVEEVYQLPQGPTADEVKGSKTAEPRRDLANDDRKRATQEESEAENRLSSSFAPGDEPDTHDAPGSSALSNEETDNDGAPGELPF